MKKVILLGFLAFWMVGEARAYIPPDWFVLRTVATRHAGHRNVKIRGHLFVQDESSARYKTLTEVYWNARKRIVSVSNLDGQELYRKDFPLASSSEKTKIALASLFFETQPDQLAQALQHSGVKLWASESVPDPVPARSLGRWNQKVAWVLGGLPIGHPGLEGKMPPQVWLEKDSFHLLRVMKEKVEIQMDGHRTIRDFTFPTRLSLLEEGKPILREEIREVLVDSDLKDPVGLTPAGGFTEQGNGLSSSEQEVVLNFVNGLR